MNPLTLIFIKEIFQLLPPNLGHLLQNHGVKQFPQSFPTAGSQTFSVKQSEIGEPASRLGSVSLIHGSEDGECLCICERRTKQTVNYQSLAILFREGNTIPFIQPRG